MSAQRLGFFSKYGTPIAVVTSVALLLVLAPSKAPSTGFGDTVAAGGSAPSGDGAGDGAPTGNGDQLAGGQDGDAVDAGGTSATVLGVQTGRTGQTATTTGGRTGSASGGSTSGGSTGGSSTGSTPRFGGTSSDTAGADCTRSLIFKSQDFGCKPAWSGNNGGATYTKGVSGDKVKAVFYVGNTGATLAEEPAQAATVCGIPNPTPEQFDRTIQTFNKFLNKHYQTYGRTVEYRVHRAQALSTDSAATRAEAVKVDQEVNPFIIVNSFANEFVDETSRRGIVNFGGVGLSGAFLRSHAPYVFQLGHDTDTGNELLAEYIAKRVHPFPTQWTGDDATQGPGKAKDFSPPRGVQRRYAIVYPGDAAQQLTTIGPDLAARMQRWGIPAGNIRTFGYQSDVTTWSTQAANLVSQMRSLGITNVMFLNHPVFVSFFTLQATQQEWYPEYIITDFATQGSSGTWRAIAANPVNGVNTYSQGKRAFGLAMSAAPSAVFQRCNGSPVEAQAYAAFKSIEPNLEPAAGFIIPWLGMWVTAQAIENAGPRLDPGGFRDGMWKIKPVPPTSPTSNLFGYGPGDFSGSQDAVEIWFNPTKNTRGPKDPPGEFEYVADGMRYTFGQFPAAKTEAFRPECLGPGGCGTAPKWPGR